MPATIDIPQQIISIDAETLVKFSVNGGMGKLKNLFIREEKMANWAIPLRDWVVNELGKGRETLHVSQSGVILPKFVTPSLVVWACIFLAVCNLEVECTDSEFDTQKRKIVSWQSRECGFRPLIEADEFHPRFKVPSRSGKTLSKDLDTELEEVNDRLNKMLSGDDQTTIEQELENIPTAGETNPDEDEDETNRDSIIPDETDFKFDEEEIDMKKTDDAGTMDDLQGEAGGDAKKMPDSEKFAETTKGEKVSGPTVFAVSQKGQEQKSEASSEGTATTRTKRPYHRKLKPEKVEEKPIEIPTGSRGLILKMIEAGEKEAQDKDIKLELFGNLYGEFDYNQCRVIEQLLSEAQQNCGSEYPFGYFMNYQKAIKMIFEGPRPTFYQRLAGVRNHEAALFTNLSGAKGKNARIVPVPMAFARARNLFAEEFLKPIEPESPAPSELDASEPLDEEKVPDYLGKPPALVDDEIAMKEEMMHRFERMVTILETVFEPFVESFKQNPNGFLAGMHFINDFIMRAGKLSGIEQEAVKARADFLQNPIAQAFVNGRLGF